MQLTNCTGHHAIHRIHCIDKVFVLVFVVFNLSIYDNNLMNKSVTSKKFHVVQNRVSLSRCFTHALKTTTHAYSESHLPGSKTPQTAVQRIAISFYTINCVIYVSLSLIPKHTFALYRLIFFISVSRKGSECNEINLI